MSQRGKKKLQPKTIPHHLAAQVQAGFQQALALHQNGQLVQAQAIFTEILKVQPRHSDALHLLGVIAAQTNNLQRAVTLFDKAIEINSDNANLYFNRGLALQNLNQLEAALASYDRAIAIAPDYIEALNNRGLALQNLNQLEAALASYDRAIVIAPDYAEACNNRGNVLQELKQFEAALTSYNRALAIKPDYADACNNRGIALKELKQLEAALASYDQAIAIKPAYAAAYYNRGNVLQELKQFEAALTSYNSALAINPDYAEALCNRSIALRDLKQFAAALASCNQAIAIKPDYAEAYSNRGITLRHLKQFEAALASCEQAMAIAPDYVEAYNNRGNILQELKQFEAALASYDQAIAIKPDYAEAYNNRGNALQKLKRFELALTSYNKAIAIAPDYCEACNNRGNVLQELKQFEAALASYDRALAMAPDYIDAHINRGIALQKLKQFEIALASYDKALAINPDYAKALCNRGVALLELRQLDAALASYNQAIAIEPDYSEALNNRGVALHKLRLSDAALASYDQAIAIDPDYCEAYYNRGITFHFLKQHQAAAESYDKALSIRPDYEFLYGMRVHTKMHICDWRDAENQLADLIEKIKDNEKASTPFPVLALSDSLPLQRKAAEIWVKATFPENILPGNTARHPRHDKIRLGYFSMDFRIHPVSALTAELFETHDRSRFEVIAFSYGPDTRDEMRQRLEGAFDRFIEVRARSDQEIAELARRMEIDIAIDLAGHTSDARTGIFAMRAAPVQVNFLGYPGTMGADYIDYLIADRQLIPEWSEAQYAEKIVYLPSFQPNDSKRRISGRVFTRAELGLPESGFVFCCFNNSYKITPGVFAGWMRILKQVAGSVLWLSETSPAAADNLRHEAAKLGIEARRLVFAKREPLAEDHLARHRAADLFIDTLPYNAHTTASDALWAGLPVLTCPGEALASRVAASLLTTIELPELIARTQGEYEALAVALATDPERLKAIREKLARNRLTSPLFDTGRFTRHLEDACARMYERCQAGLPPEHIEVE